jgi:hypothetical protein
MNRVLNSNVALTVIDSFMAALLELYARLLADDPAIKIGAFYPGLWCDFEAEVLRALRQAAFPATEDSRHETS